MRRWCLVRGMWLGLLLGLALAPGLLRGATLDMATFRVEVTPPIGEGPCLGYMPRVEWIEHPLELRGVVLRTPKLTCVLAAIDFCGLCNSSDRRLREALADAAGTTPDQVALQSLHQHSAPVLDLDGAKLLFGPDSDRVAQHVAFTEAIATKATAAIGAAVRTWTPVRRIVASRAVAERLGANRRIPQPDGSLAVRASYTAEPDIRDAPEGLIDPWVRTLTFFGPDQPIVQFHYYASHPQTIYGDGRISWDVPGLARARLEEETGVFPIYWTGCGGNIAFGKYNQRTAASRRELADRLYDAMARAHRVAVTDVDPATITPATRRDQVVELDRLEESEIRWSMAPLAFTPRDDGPFRPEALQRELQPDRPFSARLTAAAAAAWFARLGAGHRSAMQQLRLGPIDLLHLPGEPFVEFQLFAQQADGARFVAVAGYGECGMWYYGPDRIYTEVGGYEQTWSFTGPCAASIEQAITRLVRE